MRCRSALRKWGMRCYSFGWACDGGVIRGASRNHQFHSYPISLVKTEWTGSRAEPDFHTESLAPTSALDLYRESLIYWVRGSHFNIVSFITIMQQQHITPLFLTRSAQLPHPSRVSCSDLFLHGKYTQEKRREGVEFVGRTSYHIN